MDFLGEYTIPILGAFIIYIVVNLINSNNIKLLKKKINNIDGFTPTKYVISYGGDKALAIDEQKKQFCLLKNNSKEISYTIYNYKDLLESKIMENENNIILDRGILVGQRVVDRVENISLQLIIKDNIEPFIFILNILKGNGIGFEKIGNIYKQHIDKAIKWNAIMKMIIKEENKKVTSTTKSIADEIIKFKNLKDEGLISEEEFEIQKNKLLNS